MMNVVEYAKAIAAAVTAAGATTATALLDGHITPGEWITIVVATIVAAAAVFTIPNTTPAALDGPITPGPSTLG